MIRIIVLIFALILLIASLGFCIYLGLLIDKRRKEFYATLNEHEKAIVSEYMHCSLFPFKKGGKQ